MAAFCDRSVAHPVGRMRIGQRAPWAWKRARTLASLSGDLDDRDAAHSFAVTLPRKPDGGRAAAAPVTGIPRTRQSGRLVGFQPPSTALSA